MYASHTPPNISITVTTSITITTLNAILFDTISVPILYRKRTYQPTTASQFVIKYKYLASSDWSWIVVKTNHGQSCGYTRSPPIVCLSLLADHIKPTAHNSIFLTNFHLLSGYINLQINAKHIQSRLYFSIMNETDRKTVKFCEKYCGVWLYVVLFNRSSNVICDHKCKLFYSECFREQYVR